MGEPEKPGTAGKRYLFFDVTYGNFSVITQSYAKVNCPTMDFRMYPFDTHRCEFSIANPTKNISYQVNIFFYLVAFMHV